MSWEIQVSHLDQPPELLLGRTSSERTPTGSQTPAHGEHVLRHRLALVLTQRARGPARPEAQRSPRNSQKSLSF